MKSSDKFPLLLDCSFPSRAEHLAWIEHSLHERALSHIVTLNAEMVVEAARNESFRSAALLAERKLPDGSSMLWAHEFFARRGSVPLSLLRFFFSKQKPITGVDTIFDICRALQRMRGTAYLLGGDEGDRTKTATILRKRYPSLTITPLSDQEAMPNLQAIRSKRSAGTSSVLFVAYGAPKQTLWIEQHRDMLQQANIRIAMGVGGAFAMISGRLMRAPKFLRIHHLEWLWRLYLEPNRIRRIWNAVVVFPKIVAGYPH